MSTPENYISFAIAGEAAVVASAPTSTRNNQLYRSAFKLGRIPDMPKHAATDALMKALETTGYLKEHSRSDTLGTIERGLRTGQSHPRTLIARDKLEPDRKPIVANPLVVAANEPKVALFPPRTSSDHQGKPTFLSYGRNGPPVRPSEKRRHVFMRESEPVRIKVMLKNGGAVNWFRVQNADGALGWQARKPDGFIEVPYVGGADPFDCEVLADDLYWPEGEKDVDSIIRLGALALTFGGTGDGLPAGCESCFVGRTVIILADNDEGGRKHAERKAALIHPVARSIRIVHFPELPEKGALLSSEAVELLMFCSAKWSKQAKLSGPVVAPIGFHQPPHQMSVRSVRKKDRHPKTLI
jgi:hypothetical protein